MTNNWPNPGCPGEPLTPGKAGAHQITNGAVGWPVPGPWILLWAPMERHWTDLWGNKVVPGDMARHRYVGPCLTPDEVEARVAGAQAKMRASAAVAAQDVPYRPGQTDIENALAEAYTNIVNLPITVGPDAAGPTANEDEVEATSMVAAGKTVREVAEWFGWSMDHANEVVHKARRALLWGAT